MEATQLVNMTSETSDIWQAGLDALKKGEIITMDEETYWHFLGCVPPAVQNESGFVCIFCPERANRRS